MTEPIAMISAAIRPVPDFPKPGILFRDITTLLLDPDATAAANSMLIARIRNLHPTHIAAIESRGFLFGATVASELRLPLCIIRKPGKLPSRTIRETYDLEYGSDAIELHEDALAPGNKVVIIDDLLATGGTAAAAGRLVAKCGAEVAGFAFVVELKDLGGREKLLSAPVISLVMY
jgi:adenine phosphoribosyltransferase